MAFLGGWIYIVISNQIKKMKISQPLNLSIKYKTTLVPSILKVEGNKVVLFFQGGILILNSVEPDILRFPKWLEIFKI